MGTLTEAEIESILDRLGPQRAGEDGAEFGLADAQHYFTADFLLDAKADDPLQRKLFDAVAAAARKKTLRGPALARAACTAAGEVALAEMTDKVAAGDHRAAVILATLHADLAQGRLSPGLLQPDAAHGQLVFMMLLGEGVLGDLDAAELLLKRAADAGDARAIAEYGRMLEDGWGSRRSVADAEALYRKAADARDPAGQTYLAGRLAPKAPKEAERLLRAAADTGYGGAKVALARLYDSGAIGPPDPQKAAQLLKESGDFDPIEKELEELASLAGKDPKEYEAALNKAAAELRFFGVDGAFYYGLGMRYATGARFPKSDEKALKYIARAARYGYREAIGEEGWRMCIGLGTPADVPTGVARLAKAAKRGSLRAYGRLVLLAETEPAAKSAVEDLRRTRVPLDEEGARQVAAAEGAARQAAARASEAAAEKARLLATATDKQYQALVDRGNAHLHKGEFADAIKAADGAIQLAPQRGAAYLLRGHTHYGLKQLAKALDDFSAAARLDTGKYREEAVLNRGALYHIMGDYNRAVADFTWVIEWSKDEAHKQGAHFARGVSHMELRALFTATEDFTAAIKLGRKGHDVYRQRGVTYIMLKRPDDAVRDLNSALKLAPRAAECYYFRAAAYALNKDRDAALADLRQAVKLDPNQKEYAAALKKVEGTSAGDFIGMAVAAGIVLSALDGPADARAADPGAQMPKRQPLKRTVTCPECKGTGDAPPLEGPGGTLIFTDHKCSECRGHGKIVHWMDKFMAGPGHE